MGTHCSTDYEKELAYWRTPTPGGEQNRFALGQDITLLTDVTAESFSTLHSREGLLCIVYCTEGELSFTMNGRRIHLRKSSLFLTTGEHIFPEHIESSNFHAVVSITSRSFTQSCITGLIEMWKYLPYIYKNPVLELTESENEWIWTCINRMRFRLTEEHNAYTYGIVAAMMRVFYFDVCNMLDHRYHPEQSPTMERSYAIFDKFIYLLSAHFKQERSVEWYSSEMCVTPKHLSEVVKEVSGRPTSQWITTFVITEIKRLLKFTTLNMKEIAQEMGFSNQSFMGKYFKNAEGVSPSDYRKDVQV